MTTTALERTVHVDFSGDAPMISARELHDALEIQTPFRQWFPRMLKYGFQEGSDYVKVLQKSEGSRTGQTEIDYLVSVDMAKHICMIQRSQKGMQYRQYFLEIERAWNSPEKVMARALQIAKKQIEELQTRCFCLSVENRRQEGLIREIKPKAEYADKVLQSKSLLLTTQIAKDYGMSAVKFNRLLYDLGIQYRVGGQWVLYAKYQNQGYTASTTVTFPKSDGTFDSKQQTEWTQKGRRFLYLILKDHGYIPSVERQLLEMTSERR
jgi:anti-repressor protein